MLATILAIAFGAVSSTAGPTLFSTERDPFRHVFAVPSPVGLATHPTPPREQVICGMRVITPDPSIDRSMAMHLPQKGVQFTIRTLTPRICRQ